MINSRSHHHLSILPNCVKMSLWFLFHNFLCLLIFDQVYGLASTLKNVSPLTQLTTSNKFQQAALNDAVIYIDVENVRGKSGFGLSHADVIHSTSIWAKEYGLENRVSLIVDHGSVPSGYYFKERGLGIIFAGKKFKADDIIVRDIPFCQDKLHRDVVVITQDYELMQRCKRAAHRSGGKELSIIPPLFFLADLQSVVGETLVENIESDENLVEKNSTNDTSTATEVHDDDKKIASDAELEITLGAKLIGIESQLRSKGRTKKSIKSISKKKRKKLEKQAEKIRAKLGLRGRSTLERATSIIANEGANEDGLDFEQQNILLKKWESLRQLSKRRELTGDRVLLAEALRRDLEMLKGSYTSHVEVDLERMVPSEAHANYANSLITGIPRDLTGMTSATESLPLDEMFQDKETIRFVIVSDTHGCERSLTTDSFEPWFFTNKEEDDTYDSRDGLLPDGDVLLHLGDFAIDRGGNARRKALERFDIWLSHQPHPLKIVVRGNHDPYTAEFPVSKAMYVTKPMSLNLGDKVLAMIPFGHGGFSTSKLQRSYSDLLPPTCDVLATHEPPHNILDKCLSGDRAGSSLIRSAVEHMKGLPPKLWAFGHIHEGRGSIKKTFGKGHDRETVLINAANANPGRAHQLEYGPVVVDISNEINVIDGKEDKRVEKSNTIKKREKQENEQELLLAIDLGLKCGASLFDDSGKLLRYEQLKFNDPKDLYDQAPLLIESWEKDANEETSLNSGEQQKKKILSYLAIEGGGDLFDAWETSVDNEDKKHIQLVSVRPEEWRAHLLLPNERQSSRTCKEAARLLARQVVAECGNMDKHEGKFKTDAAESVTMGYYMANHLGWIKRKPIVERYTNGKIVVPSKL